MKLNRKMIKRSFKYVALFLLVIAIYQFFCFPLNYGDPISSYGFSYAIARGEVPYLDFNMISTPLYAFYGSVFLMIWNNYLMFIISHALLVTVTFFFLYQLYGKKSYLILAILIGIYFFGILATYNFMCFTMLIIILYLEEKYSDKDYLIGLFIGFAILSKHTVGCFFIIPTFIKYFKNPKKIGKRAVGCFIPCSILFIYLMMNGAFYSFIDLCFLGLFDFSASNGKLFTPLFYLAIFVLILAIYLTYLNSKDIKNYYLLFSFFFTVPLFDWPHMPLFIASFMMMMIPYLRWKAIYDKVIFLNIVSFCLIFSLIEVGQYEMTFSSLFRHFEYTMHYKAVYQSNLELLDFLDEYDDAVILSYFTMQYDIIHDNDIDYYDIMLYGNFGYDGVNKMIENIKHEDRHTFIVSRYDYQKDTEDSQFAKKIVDYVIDNGCMIDSKYGYDVYYLE